MEIAEAPRARLSGLAQESWLAARPAVVPLCQVALGYAPLLILRARALFDRPQPAALPLAVLAGVLLTWKASRRLGRLEPGAWSWSVAAVGLGMAALVVAGFSAWALLGTAAAMTTLLAVAYGIGGARLLRAVLPAWAFVTLAVLFPVETELWLVGVLQRLVTACGSGVLDALGVIHLTEGNVIEIESGPLMAEQACRGVPSLFAAIGVTLFFALWTRRKLVTATVLVLASAFWMVLANVVRVAAVVFVDARWGVDLASGRRYDVWDLGIFATVMGLTLSTDQLLRFLASLTTIRLSWPAVCQRGSDLRLMSSVRNISEIMTSGRSRVVVAVLDQVLHFRIVGGDGWVVVDTDEKALPEQARMIAYLRRRLKGLWPPHELTNREKVGVIAIVTSILDQPGKRAGLESRSDANRQSPARLEAGEHLTPTEFADVGRTWLASRRLGSAFAVLGILQVVWLWPPLAKAVGGSSGPVTLQSSVVALKSLNEGDLPDHFGPYLRQAFDAKVHDTGSSLGEFSREWHYHSDRAKALAAVDFPFRGWHDVTECYKNTGWTMKHYVVRAGDGPDAAGAGAFVEAAFERPPDRHAALIYGIDDMGGDSLKPPPSTDVFEFREKLDVFRFVRGRLGARADSEDKWTTDGYQVRLLIQTGAPLSADQWTEARATFSRLRQDVRRRVASGTGPGAKGGSS